MYLLRRFSVIVGKFLQVSVKSASLVLKIFLNMTTKDEVDSEMDKFQSTMCDMENQQKESQAHFEAMIAHMEDRQKLLPDLIACAKTEKFTRISVRNVPVIAEAYSKALDTDDKIIKSYSQWKNRTGKADEELIKEFEADDNAWYSPARFEECMNKLMVINDQVATKFKELLESEFRDNDSLKCVRDLFPSVRKKELPAPRQVKPVEEVKDNTGQDISHNKPENVEPVVSRPSSHSSVNSKQSIVLQRKINS